MTNFEDREYIDNGEVVEQVVQQLADPKESIKSAAQAARELIPVGPQGAMPMNFAQQVDFAKSMTAALRSIPKHLRNNVGDCLAVIEIANHAKLSAYMLARATYVPQGGDNLEFTAQAYHALAQGSGLMEGSLHPEWSGEGDDRRCTVTGYLKGDPRPKILRSQTLKELHPGRVNKDGRTFVKGSPLWDRKPDIQLFYDTSRDWVRIYVPRAVLGIYTPDEMVEHDINNPLPDPDPGLRARLTGKTGDGHRDGHAETELAKLNKPPKGKKVHKTIEVVKEVVEEVKEPTQARESEPPIAETTPQATQASPRSRKRTSGAARATATPAPQATSEEVDPKVAAPVDAAAYATEQPQTKTQKVSPPKKPKTAAEYIAYAENWIASDEEPAARWQTERDIRDDLQVPLGERKRLEALIMERK